ncbi:cupin [Cupriavidus sp. SK-4]|uniref:(R)-mandelonitrile lyase n=1 Tax=Cupriavidus sp. SK-4 TaxID=574750 RepID=UPI00044C1B8E|nr:carboxymuconolactone decarboxylase family protein [Cupriavidus sp. SK-4]EYS84936.1 cupin [Cupriavidus sp. SK-4]
MRTSIAIATLALSMMDAAGAAEPDLQISRAASRQVQAAPAQNFTGSVQVEMLFTPTGPDRTSAGTVTFSPGARTAWHTHPLGQTLIVTAGVGRVQRWGGPVQEIRPGDVVRIPPNTRHWHGAAADSAMTHMAIQEARDGKAVDWLEQVSDAQYSAGMAAPRPAAQDAAQPSVAQRCFGDVAPKLAQLTDDVLFGDVWARPGLSPRDRSLVTVSALIAMNRPDQLRSHMALARENGLTEAELVEALTHLAFYAGWPSAVTAAGIARETFNKKPQ